MTTKSRLPLRSAVAMGRDSLDFLAAGKKLIDGSDPQLYRLHLFGPTYFLLCQSIELALKAYLRAKGYDDPRLANIGHSLIDALEAASNEGLNTTREFDEMVHWMDKYHRQHVFRYHKNRFLHVPLPQEFVDRIEPQIRATYAAIAHTIRAQLQARAD